MALTLCVLGSGSSGNCTYVGSESTRVLIDAGLSRAVTLARLAAAGSDISRIAAILVTHEHGDHTASIAKLHRKFGMPLYANAATIEAIEQGENNRGLPWNVFTTGSPFQIGDLKIEPFSVPHDSLDPVGFVVSSGGSSAAIVSDIGVVTTLVRERLRQCQIAVIESNHDENLLRNARRPWSLKQRIAGTHGHLSNAQAAELIAGVAHSMLKTVFLAHISEQCNRPQLALKTMARALQKNGKGHVEVKLTFSGQISDIATW